MPKIQYDGKGFPVYDPDDGWKDYGEFQAAALNDMDKQSRRQQVQKPASALSQPLRGMVDVLPAAGAAMGGMAEPLGGEVLGAGAGTAIKNILRSKYPQTFGSNPPTATGQAADIGTDMGLSMIPGLAGPAAKAIAGGVSKMPLVGSGIKALLDELPSLSKGAQSGMKDLMRLIQPIIKTTPPSSGS